MDCEVQPKGSSKKRIGRPIRSKRAVNQAAYRRRVIDLHACYMIDNICTADLEETLRGAGKLNIIEPTHEHVRVALRELITDLITDHLERDR